ncbi:copper homeostasis membrane protein CopD [Pseudomonas sp. HR96]|uniref:copper homeostasis membrane protein CopD n=1 Tax=Pseudomonas sp. HR96 TaxID=1027966 RepID=UPI002A75F9F0|nr:copper homeostasis membrane protein CopD [Pseudomonas sp. HR96]WPO98344.1 copper homeostasis membrane protein CopD [Pseudomonas sp. HR96]
MSALVIVRFIHFAALMLVFGASMFRGLMLDHPAQQSRIRNLLDPLLCLLAGVALVSAALWLVLLAADMHGVAVTALDFAAVKKVLGETFFGKVWSLHLLLCAALLLVLRIPTARGAVIARPLSALALATLAPVGHAVMLDGLDGTLLVINQLVHLFCVGAWMGALMLLTFLLAKPKGQDMGELLLRFSSIGLVLVIGVLVTGLINVRVLTGSFWPVPGQSPFATVLAVKAAMVLCMLALAAWHRRRLHRPPVSQQQLRWTVGIEWALGFGALAAVSLLGTLAPVPVN